MALPGPATARGYRREWLRTDIVAGFVLTALLIPAGMGYAEAAGLPAYAGLYATIVPLLTYAVLGPSKILVLGPDSSLAPLIAAAVLPLAAVATRRAHSLSPGARGSRRRDPHRRGLPQPRVRHRTAVEADPRRVSQCDRAHRRGRSASEAARLSVDASGLIDEIAQIGSRWLPVTSMPSPAAVGVGSLAVIVAFRLWWSRIPGVLVAVVGSIVLCAAIGLDDRIGMVGALPKGLPLPSFGGVDWVDVLQLIGPAAGIALIAFADRACCRGRSPRAAVRCERQYRDEGDRCGERREWAVRRVPDLRQRITDTVAEQSGAHTQLAGVVGALAVLAFVLVAPGVTAYLPDATLAAVVIVAATALIDVKGMARLWQMSR